MKQILLKYIGKNIQINGICAKLVDVEDNYFSVTIERKHVTDNINMNIKIVTIKCYFPYNSIMGIIECDSSLQIKVIDEYPFKTIHGLKTPLPPLKIKKPFK